MLYPHISPIYSRGSQGASFSLCWQMLQVTYGGWQNVSMTQYFRDYADLCFEVFGDRVKHWLTFSDPRVSRGSSSDGETGMSLLPLMLLGSPLLSLQTMVEKGYETGLHAPGLRLPGTGLYVAAHHIIKVSQVLPGQMAPGRAIASGHADPLQHQYVPPWALL